MNAKTAKRIRRTISNWRERRYVPQSKLNWRTWELHHACGRNFYKVAKRAEKMGAF